MSDDPRSGSHGDAKTKPQATPAGAVREVKVRLRRSGIVTTRLNKQKK